MFTIEHLKNKKFYRNAILSIKEMKHKRTILEYYPFKVFVEPTQRCDLDCTICSKSRHSSKIDMSLELFYKIEKELFPDIDKYAPRYLEKYNPYNGDCPHRL